MYEWSFGLKLIVDHRKPPANFPPVETDPEALPDQSSEKVVS